LFTWNRNATVYLKIIDINGNKQVPPEGYNDQLPLEYYYPDNILKACNLDEYFEKYSDRTEAPKTEKGKYDSIYVKWGLIK